MTRLTVKGVLAGVAAFTVTTIATIAATTLATGGEPAARLAPLQPASGVEPPESGPVATTRSDLTFPVDGGKAGAVLVEPEGGAEVGVVIVAGAGGSGRGDLLALAEQFAEHGVAALTYDKRADGYTFFRRDYPQLADDVIAAAAAMRASTGIDRIGALGISEGGWVISDAAARPSTPLAFTVLASAPVVTPGEQSAWIVDSRLQASPAWVRLALATINGQGRFLMDYFDFDIRPRLAAAHTPVMAIWGAEDAIVPINEAYRRLDAALDGVLVARIFPGLGHDMSADVDVWLPAVAAWIRQPDGAGLSGVGPSSDLGVAPIPPPRWYSDPRLHLAVAILATITTVVTITHRTSASQTR
ncbi:hypothetical protein BW730_04835 [Tessaracoccus aquimaris]|uniref:Peptidase S9 prolyl oligopeptidase catalytic domain-containing protein n=1 Tax=Tessaracoccus aquimaris TaxID=1332264 RepID=A0A1Q2CLG2_9ACTN|nr:alpha/beta hydrolase [Tessaracoccus aquimaris]AQP46947.1 hypothetical protein BW730_04835 [Tessaracoccus aquimaris]